MKCEFTFTKKELDKVRIFIEEWKDSKKVRERRARNEQPLPASASEKNEEAIWKMMIDCLLTTQQRVGDNSNVGRFLKLDPFPLTLAVCRGKPEKRRVSFFKKTLTHHKCIRFTKRVPKWINENLEMLNDEKWVELRAHEQILLQHRKEKATQAHYQAEEEAARYMARFRGIGTKQGRNFWQGLGLTRYSVVIDSNVLEWMENYLKPERGLLTRPGLADEAYYQFVSRLILVLCIRINVLPCMLDAAIMAWAEERRAKK